MSTETLQSIHDISAIIVLFLFISVMLIQILRIIPKFDDFINNTKTGLIIVIFIVIISIAVGIPAIISDIKLDDLARQEHENRKEECADLHKDYANDYNFCPNCGDLLDE